MKRQGNQNEKVHEYTYVTKDTFDANRFQTLEMKQGYISQIMTNHNPMRSCDDISPEEVTFAEVKAACVGNPMIKEKMELDIEVNKLQLLKSSYLKSHYRLEDMICKILPEKINKEKSEYSKIMQDYETAKVNPLKRDPEGKIIFDITIGDKRYTDKESAGNALVEVYSKLLIKNDYKRVPIGSYRGFRLEIFLDGSKKDVKVDIIGSSSNEVILGNDKIGNLQRIENAVNGLERNAKACINNIEYYKKQLEEAKIEYAKPFPQEQELAEKLERKNIVEREIKKQNNDVKIDNQEQPEHEQEASQEYEASHEHEPVHDRQIVQTDNKRKRDNSMSL